MIDHKLSVENKSLENLSRELKERGSIFLCKFENLRKSRICDLSKINFYKKVYTHYYEVAELFNHIIKYGNVIAPDYCTHCKARDKDHISSLKSNFKVYKNLILYCRDGSIYKKICENTKL